MERETFAKRKTTDVGIWENAPAENALPCTAIVVSRKKGAPTTIRKPQGRDKDTPGKAPCQEGSVKNDGKKQEFTSGGET
ncbi:MAG: hypothetical protein K2L09_06700, partial [Alistipes sp.]|nr:hypothetical protein [Alistipes sp.]